MKVAIVPFDGVGHLNPQLALASKLMERGHHCRWFLGSPEFEEQVMKLGSRSLSTANHFSLSRVYEGGEGGEDSGDFSHAGLVRSVARFENQTDGDRKCSDILMGLLTESVKQMPTFLREVRLYEPDLIL